jgi:hypothetical protein
MASLVEALLALFLSEFFMGFSLFFVVSWRPKTPPSFTAGQGLWVGLG